jgi:hypothetical protein
MRPFEAPGRMIPATHSICMRAADVLHRLADVEIDPQRRRSLSNDALIAKCTPLVWFPSVNEFVKAGTSR